ncbi:cell division protein SepF [Dendrosporobacter sp. 1207_IL3150]|uniref:cell division protein SepF n=1 Tax=Dendrosporobacter sp. 1207_IL3150 TaxID=3084054 RepID=UPI002FD94D5D
MTVGLIHKLTNFLMPIEEEADSKSLGNSAARPNFTVHSNAADELKLFIAVPRNFDDAKGFADRLKAKEAIIVNYEHVDQATQQRIGDFLNGVCYITAGAVQRISDNSIIYVPENVDINKELYAYSIPTYIKQ